MFQIRLEKQTRCKAPRQYTNTNTNANTSTNNNTNIRYTYKYRYKRLVWAWCPKYLDVAPLGLLKSWKRCWRKVSNLTRERGTNKQGSPDNTWKQDWMKKKRKQQTMLANADVLLKTSPRKEGAQEAQIWRLGQLSNHSGENLSKIMAASEVQRGHCWQGTFNLSTLQDILGRRKLSLPYCKFYAAVAKCQQHSGDRLNFKYLVLYNIWGF